MIRPKNPRSVSLLCALPFLVLILSVAGCAGGGYSGSTVLLGIDPISVSVPVGQPQEFHAQTVEGAPEKLNWKVQEGDAGGTIVVVPIEGYDLDYTVTYTAPQTVGTYHVQVSGKYYDGSTKNATATVKVE